MWLENNFSKNEVAELHKTYVDPVYEGKISEDEFFIQMSVLLNREPKVIKEEWTKLSRINNEVIELIKKLKNKYKIGLCTDAFVPFVEELLDKNKITALFDEIAISSVIKTKKPNKDIYDHILKELGVEAENSIFIDDQKKNILGAEAIGMRGILYVDIDQTTNNLKALGLL